MTQFIRCSIKIAINIIQITHGINMQNYIWLFLADYDYLNTFVMFIIL